MVDSVGDGEREGLRERLLNETEGLEGVVGFGEE